MVAEVQAPSPVKCIGEWSPLASESQMMSECLDRDRVSRRGLRRNCRRLDLSGQGRRGSVHRLSAAGNRPTDRDASFHDPYGLHAPHGREPRVGAVLAPVSGVQQRVWLTGRHELQAFAGRAPICFAPTTAATDGGQPMEVDATLTAAQSCIAIPDSKAYASITVVRE